MIRCKEVAALLNSEALAGAGFRKRLEVRLHLAMCRQCRSFARQIERLRAAVRSLGASLAGEAERKDLEARLLRKLSGE